MNALDFIIEYNAAVRDLYPNAPILHPNRADGVQVATIVLAHRSVMTHSAAGIVHARNTSWEG